MVHRCVPLSAIAAAVFLAPAGASAATFTVNTTSDLPDAALGDNLCVAVGGRCTLRAALDEANHASNPDADTINFSGFTGNAATSTITLSGNLFVGAPATIDGGNCGTASTPKPCVGLDASGDDGIIVGQAPGSTISGLAISDAEGESKVAIGVSPDSPNLILRNSWFGIRLDGTLEANDEGISMQADGLVLGGTTAADRNVFAHQLGRAVSIAGGDNAVILGNYFGTMPDGQTTVGVGNSVGVKVVATPTRSATGTVIGGPDAGTPGLCDGPCNVIANSSLGIDLTAGGGDVPADQVQISGNFVGLDRAGSQHLPITLDAIRAADADNVTIGGANSTDRNYIAGSVDATGGAGNLVIRNNFIGLNALGTQLMGAGGHVTLLGGIASPVVCGNRVASGIAVVGDGSDIRGNTVGVGVGGEDVGGAGFGIFVTGNGSTIGGSGDDANLVGHMESGIGVSGSNNLIPRNFVGENESGTERYPNSGTGINVSDGDGNVVGSPGGGFGNAVSNSGDDAIRVFGADNDRNTIANNGGRNNGDAARDLFIDLVDAGGGEGLGNSITGPNNGLQAPVISSVTQAGAAGTAPAGLANYTIQVFLSNQANGSATFRAGQTSVVSGANWSVNFTEQIDDGQCIQATVTDEIGDTSELSNQLCEDETGSPNPPDTTLDPFPNLTNDATPTLGFVADQDVKRFECRLYPSASPPPAFQACSGAADAFEAVGHTTPALTPDGSYTFEVRGVDLNDNVESSAAGATFTLDTIPPTLTITSGPNDGEVTLDHSPAFGFTTDGQGAECRFDGQAFGACEGAGTHAPAAPLSDGAHSFSVRVTDAAGNQATVTRSFAVTTSAAPPPDPPGPPAGGDAADTDPPETTLTKVPSIRTRSNRVTYRFTSDEEGVSFRCKFDKRPFKPCSSPLPIKRLRKGRHRFQVVATDEAGNTDPTAASDRFRRIG